MLLQLCEHQSVFLYGHQPDEGVVLATLEAVLPGEKEATQQPHQGKVCRHLPLQSVQYVGRRHQ